jgi:hypothetical protein
MRFIISLSIVLIAFDATKIRRIKQAYKRSMWSQSSHKTKYHAWSIQGVTKKGNPTLACYRLIVHYILRLSIYFFHTNKDQPFWLSNAIFLVSYCDLKRQSPLSPSNRWHMMKNEMFSYFVQWYTNVYSETWWGLFSEILF